jgi:hypothetical protein
MECFCIFKYLEKELVKDAAFTVLDRNTGLDAEKGILAYLDHCLNVLLVLAKLLLPMDQELVESIEQIPEGLLVFVKDLPKVRKYGPDCWRNLLGFFNKSL